MSTTGKFQVESWDEERDGQLNEHNLKKKLHDQGYSFLRYTFPSGTDFPNHTHSYEKKDSILTGQFRFAMFGQEVVLKPGDMVVVPANVVHSASVVGQDDVVFFDASKE
ncbi:predicted protein [Nematostella vectensis]|uniref:Cupin type-2 domain-containing protein n=1 Tax=Nematostella vectensis TaxID=45351 RepID=A7SC54_NEMVE|nr:uncharacterized protein LOC5510268 [Nematostella vectensis]EDO38681.1 predicted protein [Nematostella vectensis]|eukprot:XP_001630744.1 predicted protein [Nematostella vectensis]